MSEWTKKRHEEAKVRLHYLIPATDVPHLSYSSHAMGWFSSYAADALAEIERMQGVIEEATTLLDLYQSNRSPGLRDLDEQACEFIDQHGTAVERKGVPERSVAP